MKDKRLWLAYCRSLGINPYNRDTFKSAYYQEGFKEWKRLKESFSYYRYMSYNV